MKVGVRGLSWKLFRGGLGVLLRLAWGRWAKPVMSGIQFLIWREIEPAIFAWAFIALAYAVDAARQKLSRALARMRGLLFQVFSARPCDVATKADARAVA